jgi:hypothetical protein
VGDGQRLCGPIEGQKGQGKRKLFKDGHTVMVMVI